MTARTAIAAALMPLCFLPAVFLAYETQVRLSAFEGVGGFAAEPIGGPARRDRGGELGCQPLEQRVTGRVPEGVVVAFEAVEVEEHQQRRPVGGRRGAAALEVGAQAAAVAEARECVREGLLAQLVVGDDVRGRAGCPLHELA